MLKLKLNLGCGKDIKDGYINLDIIPQKGVDLIRDIKRGLPFNDDYFYEVLAQYSLTQIKDREDFIFVMNELWRVLRDDGILKVKVPNARHASTDSFNDPMDCRLFTEETFDYFNINHDYRWKAFDYGFKPWEILKIEKTGKNNSRLYVEMRPYKK